MKLGFTMNLFLQFVSICVCAREGNAMEICIRQTICESTLHVVGQAQYVDGMLPGCRPSVYWREHLFARADSNKPGLF